jgi:hypothetical protein
LKAQWQPSNPESLAKQFSRLGWIGFWMQLTLICIPIILLIFVLFFSRPGSGQRMGIDLSDYLSYGSLLVMVFTTFWFYRYTRLAKRIPDSELRPPQSSVMKILWIGLWASCLGILFSMLLLVSEVGQLLFVLMSTPLTGIPIATATGSGDPLQTLSTMDGVSLASLLFTLTAELILLAFTLWLLFRITRSSAEMAEAAGYDQDLDARAQ